MGSQCSFSRRDVEWWWQGAKRTSLAAKFWIFYRGWMTELCVPMRRQLQWSSRERIEEVTRVLVASSVTEKPADWTNAFQLEINSLADLYDVLLHGQFWFKNESKVPGRIREGDVVRAKCKEWGRKTVEVLKEDEKGKRRASVLSSFSLSWFFVIHVFMSSVHALSSLVRLFTSLRGVDFWSCVSPSKSWWFTEWLATISERGVVYRTKRMGPSTKPWGTPYMSCDGDEDELLNEVDWYLSERYDWNHRIAVDWMTKTEFRRERRILWSIVSKVAERCQKAPTKKE